MSRIGKLAIKLNTAKAEMVDQVVKISGPLGALDVNIPKGIICKIENNEISLTKDSPSFSNASWGMTRSLLSNAVTGVEKGFEKRLEMVGVGFRSSVSGSSLVLNVGYSHQVNFLIPEGIKIAVEDNTKIVVSGFDRALVGQVASNIKKVRLPEPYKGKGIKYFNENIRRKASKSQKAGASA